MAAFAFLVKEKWFFLGQRKDAFVTCRLVVSS
jgi:hypothetical protein